MAERPVLALRARIVLPLSRPPIEDGAVLVSGNRIRAVGSWAELRSRAAGTTVDLGDAILLPGLINAHCHLDYTDMAGLLPPPRTFTEWIHLMLEAKAQWDYSEYAASWLRGAHMLLRTGTTTVADIEVVPDLLPDVWESTSLRVHSFLEMTGIRARRAPRAILQEALDTADSLPHWRSRALLSPHAPYSTVPELVNATARVSRERDWPFSIHLAESIQEFEMFMHGHGEMFRWLNRNQRDMSDCGDVSPVQHLYKAGALDRRLLAIHVNYLAEGDAELLGRNDVNVVHCPRSRVYFDHSEFPYHILDTAGANICLGTDSLATVRVKPRQKVQLSMLDEARTFANAMDDVAPEDIVDMMTRNGARALGFAGRLGELTENALADLIAIPSRGDAAQACEAVLEHTGPVAASMIDGRWAIPPHST